MCGAILSLLALRQIVAAVTPAPKVGFTGGLYVAFALQLLTAKTLAESHLSADVTSRAGRHRKVAKLRKPSESRQYRGFAAARSRCPRLN